MDHPDRWKEIEREVIGDIKALHSESPRYVYGEPSQSEVIERYGVEVINLEATYATNDDGSRLLRSDLGAFDSPEALAAAHFESEGLVVMECESRPLHALFGVFTWLLIQDPGDPLGRMFGFGDRAAFDRGEEGEVIWIRLPEDFGKPGYWDRRQAAIEHHFILVESDDLLWLFDSWSSHSEGLRQYLWAHRPEDLARARHLVEVLPASVVIDLLKYLLASYWERYTGWPDLFVHDSEAFFFAEVKGSGDKLRLDQKNWIKGNASGPRLPFKLAKIHRAAESTK